MNAGNDIVQAVIRVGPETEESRSDAGEGGRLVNCPNPFLQLETPPAAKG